MAETTEPKILTTVVALTFIKQLGGCEGYPKDDVTIEHYAKILCDVAVNVAHARAIVDEFDSGFPTISQFRSVAQRLKNEKFAPKPEPDPLRDEPGTYGPRFEMGKLELIMQNAERVEKERTEMYRKIKSKLAITSFNRVSHAAVCWARRELGYKLPTEDDEKAADSYKPGEDVRQGSVDVQSELAAMGFTPKERQTNEMRPVSTVRVAPTEDIT